MTIYRNDWDLGTIPPDKLTSEYKRRIRPSTPNVKLAECAGGCGTILNSTQRRKPCPNCDHKEKRK